MKKILFLLAIGSFSLPGFAQEFTEDQSFFIGKLEVNPTLSFLASPPTFDPIDFYLTEVDFEEKNKQPRVNMVAIMEQKKRFKEREKEFDAPLWAVHNNEGSVLKVSQHIGIYGNNINYNPYTGKTFNAAFEEARPKDFTDRYSPFSPRRYYRPYYSPFLR